MNVRDSVTLVAILMLTTVTGAPAQATDPVPGPRGMTWAKSSHFDAEGVDVLSCSAGQPQCDAYKGDTSCQERRPILCFRKSGAENPGVPAPKYSQWAPGHIATTLPIQGLKLTSPVVADEICAKTHGPGWRMAEFHDGWGWGFRAFGNIRDDTKLWVRIKGQKANCWDHLPIKDCTWTPWLDRDNGGGNGDFETLSHFVDSGQACAEPEKIDCATVQGGKPWASTGQVYSCALPQGGVCLNKNLKPGETCQDYKVRFCCPS